MDKITKTNTSHDIAQDSCKHYDHHENSVRALAKVQASANYARQHVKDILGKNGYWMHALML